MNKEIIIEKLPDIEKEFLYPFFPKIDNSSYENLKEMTWEECHKGSLGAGDLYLADEMATRLKFNPGQRILELGSGNLLSSIYLAEKFKVIVYAVDLWNSPTNNYKKVKDRKLENFIIPLKLDAKNLPFSEEYFDHIFSMNSFFYFGTEKDYISYLTSFVKPNGNIGIASPCYRNEIDKNTPEYLLYDAPDYIESKNVHSPRWWKDIFDSSGLFANVECTEHIDGRKFWLDSIRWQLEVGRKIKDIGGDIKMLLLDKEEIITYLTLIAKKKNL